MENVIAGVTVQTPQLDITTVAAGGGSILTYRNGLFNAGPQSAVRIFSKIQACFLILFNRVLIQDLRATEKVAH
jgi:hypothetical protein